MKKNSLLFLFLLSTALLLFAVQLQSCKKAEAIKTSAALPEKSLESYSGLNVVHLTKDTVYTLGSQFVRNAGQELIIDEGVLIKANPLVPGVSNTGSISIMPGGVLKANGTRSNPIVFTSNAFAGSQFYNWGGIKIQGKAKNNTGNPNGDSTDFSGNLNYVRIEFASLTLDAVGNKTVIENVMVSYSNVLFQQQAVSAFTFYGGSVNCKNLVSYACGGPADYYITNGYNGKMQNIISYRHPFFGTTGFPPSNSLAGVFIKNNENDVTNAQPYTYPQISNLTVLGPNNQNGSTATYKDLSLYNGALVTTGNAFFRIRNSIFLGFPAAGYYLNDSLTALNLINNQSEIKNSFFHCNDSTRVFYLNPAAFHPYTSTDLKVFMMQASFKNQLLLNATDFKFHDPFNYDAPGLQPESNAPSLNGADFSGVFANPFFVPVTYLGALGIDNWMEGWVSFTPLKTNYNFPEYHH